MTIKLHTLSGSPFAWRVHLALEHKEIPYTLVHESFSDGSLKTPEYRAMNPRSRVPVIEDGDFTLYEAAAIVEYLEDLFPGKAPLFASDPRQRALVRRLIHEVDGDVWPHNLAMALELYFKPEPKWNLEAVHAARDGAVKELKLLEPMIAGDFLAGPLSAADFALYPFIAHHARFELRVKDLGLHDALGPKLRAWKARVEALPYFAATFPPHWR